MNCEGRREDNVFVVYFAISHIVHILTESVFQKQ